MEFIIQYSIQASRYRIQNSRGTTYCLYNIYCLMCGFAGFFVCQNAGVGSTSQKRAPRNQKAVIFKKNRKEDTRASLQYF